MADELLDKVLTRARERSYKGRSEAYRWLRERHERLAPVLASHSPSFREIAEEMAAGGICGGRGKPLTWRSVYEIWMRVCRDTEAEALALRTGVKPRKHHPSRMPDTWRPPVATPSVSPVPAASGPERAPTPAVQESGSPRSRTAADMLAGVRQQLDERSGRGER